MVKMKARLNLYFVLISISFLFPKFVFGEFMLSLPKGWVRVAGIDNGVNLGQVPPQLMEYYNDPNYKFLAFDPNSGNGKNDAIMCMCQYPLGDGSDRFIRRQFEVIQENVQTAILKRPEAKIIESKKVKIKNNIVRCILIDAPNPSAPVASEDMVRSLYYFFIVGHSLTIVAYSAGTDIFGNYLHMFEKNLYSAF